MVHETLFEAGAIPELSQLVKTITRTHREQVILLDGKPVARMVPLRRHAGKSSRSALIDTSARPSVAADTFDHLLTRAPGSAARSFSEAEIPEAIDLDRAEAWHAKHA